MNKKNILLCIKDYGSIKHLSTIESSEDIFSLTAFVIGKYFIVIDDDSEFCPILWGLTNSFIFHRCISGWDYIIRNTSEIREKTFVYECDICKKRLYIDYNDISNVECVFCNLISRHINSCVVKIQHEIIDLRDILVKLEKNGNNCIGYDYAVKMVKNQIWFHEMLKEKPILDI